MKTHNILGPAAQPQLPSPPAAAAVAAAASLNLNDIQGDILYVLHVIFYSLEANIAYVKGLE